MSADELVAGLRSRDISLSLAVAALLRAPDGDGGTPFQDVAVTYREDYLAAMRLTLPGEHLDAGVLSTDDVRRHLATSVLPRLAMDGTIEEPHGGWNQQTVARFRPALWVMLAPEAAETRRRLLEVAAQGMRTHSTAERPAAAAPSGSKLDGQGLTKLYNRRAVVDDVNVSLSQGEIVGLLGPNGAGKTTTFYMLVGLIAPQAGHILLDGEDIGPLPMFERARRGLGYLAQEPSVFRKLTVEENLLAILETLDLERAERERRLETLLDELSIKHLRRSKAYALSGGERRRLEITRALCTSPKFMMLDEPFAGVDPIAVHDIQTIVAGLRNRGIGVMISDHNVEQTLDIVDRAYIMFEGRVKVAGTVRELVFDDAVAELYLGPTLTARLRARLAPAA